MGEIVTTDVKYQPYWWDAAKPELHPPVPPAAACDVAIVVSGFTGLRAAVGFELLRAGRSVVVFDRQAAGEGAARRNAGYLGRVLKKSLPYLMRKLGAARGIAIYRELGEAFTGTVAFIERERIDCRLVRCGRFIAAASPAHYDDLARDLEAMRQHLGYEYAMVPRAEQRQEFGSDAYFGGAVIPDLAAVHPGLYHRGLLALAESLGAVISDGNAVRSLTPVGGGVEVKTDRGTVTAKDVIVGTNGYTPRELPWLARRVIPFQAYMAATEILGAARLREAIPNLRTVLDSNTNIDFFRPAPDSPRLLFGGATGSGMTDFNDIARRLHAILSRVLPQLGAAKLSHVWTGFCAGTFDLMPHIGGRDHIWHGLGYNFAGVPMGTHFGAKLAQMVMGNAEGRSVFAESHFPTLPLYSGKPWFVPLAMRYFDWKDGKRV